MKDPKQVKSSAEGVCNGERLPEMFRNLSVSSNAKIWSGNRLTPSCTKLRCNSPKEEIHPVCTKKPTQRENGDTSKHEMRKNLKKEEEHDPENKDSQTNIIEEMGHRLKKISLSDSTDSSVKDIKKEVTSTKEIAISKVDDHSKSDKSSDNCSVNITAAVSERNLSEPEEPAVEKSTEEREKESAVSVRTKTEATDKEQKKDPEQKEVVVEINKKHVELKVAEGSLLCSRSPMKNTTHNRPIPYTVQKSYSSDHCSGGIAMYVAEQPGQLPYELWSNSSAHKQIQPPLNITCNENASVESPLVSTTDNKDLNELIKTYNVGKSEVDCFNKYINGDVDSPVSIDNISIQPFKETLLETLTPRTHYNSVCSEESYSPSNSYSPQNSVSSPYETLSSISSDISPVGSPQVYGQAQVVPQWRDTRSISSSSPLSRLSQESPLAQYNEYDSGFSLHESPSPPDLLLLNVSQNSSVVNNIENQNINIFQPDIMQTTGMISNCGSSTQNCFQASTMTNIVVLPPDMSKKQKQATRPKPILPKGPISSVITESARTRLLKKLNPVMKQKAEEHVKKQPIETFTKGDEADGDTQLMILVSKPRNGLLELLYATVELMKKIPGSLAIRNKRGQSALYVACRQLPNEPLAAAYIAEVLTECGEDVSKMTFENGLPLTHCISRLGDTHIEILNELMSLKDRHLQPVFKSNQTCDINGNL